MRTAGQGFSQRLSTDRSCFFLRMRDMQGCPLTSTAMSFLSAAVLRSINQLSQGDLQRNETVMDMSPDLHVFICAAAGQLWGARSAG